MLSNRVWKSIFVYPSLLTTTFVDGGGGPPPPPGGDDLGGLPESRAKLENLLLESNDDDFIIKNSSLGDIENELLKILKD